MQFATTPVQIIRGSIRLFVYSCFLEDAVREERITSATFKEQIRLDEGGRGVDFKHTYTADGLKAETHNLILITLGTTAISTNKALEVVYGKTFNTADTSPEGSARVLLYQIRCAFAHDPLNPVWTPNPKNYNHRYIFKVKKVNPLTSESVQDWEIKFHPPSLKDKPLTPGHIGGVGGYLALLHYYLDKVQAHHKGNQSYSPSTEES